MRKVLAIGDLHFPWVHKKALTRAYSIIEQIRPDVIIQMGDLYDMFSASRFPKSHIYTPLQEAKFAKEGADEFWWLCKRASPKSKLIQIKGNHDDRPYKRMLEKAAELEPFFSVKDYFTFDKVETVHDTFHEFHIDGVLYTHGHYSRLGAHMNYYLKRVVCGHSHTGGVVFANIHERILWECNAGFLADKMSPPLRYRPTKTAKWTLGLASIDDRGPRFIPIPG